MNAKQILVLGGTGPTGQHLLKMVLDKDYVITALVRDPSKLNLTHKNLKIVRGDVLDRTSVEHAVAGNTAVLSTLGVGNTLKSHDLISNAVKNIIPAMNKAGSKRLIMLSAFGVGTTFSQANFLQKLAFRFPLKDIYRDKANADELIRNSGLVYTIVCPVKLTNGPLTENYRAGEKFTMQGFAMISRADVAHFMTGQLKDPKFINKTVILKH